MSLCMHACVRVCMRVRACVRVCVCLHLSMCVRARARAFVCVCACVRACVCLRLWVRNFFKFTVLLNPYLNSTGGVFGGSCIVKRFKLRESCKKAAKCCVIFRFVAILTVFTWLIPGCGEINLAGVTTPYVNTR